MRFTKKAAENAARTKRRAFALALGLAAGGSGLAQAANEASDTPVVLLPDDYELMKNGVVVFKLETGENLSLTADQ